MQMNKNKVVKPVFAPKNAILKCFFSYFWIFKHIFKFVLWIHGFLFEQKTQK